MTLNEWLSIPNADGSKKRKNAFAAAIGVTPTMVTEYAEGRMWPRREIVEAIERETGGDVTANDLLKSSASRSPVEARP
jgi:DNA-binding transcriptional regulator YdaS (Cro superfamily)